MIEYELHLTPCMIAVDKAVHSLNRHFFRLISGEFRGLQVDILLALEPLHHRRRVPSDRLEERLKTRVELATLVHNEREIGSATEDQQAFFNHIIAVKRESPTDRTSLHNR